MKEWGWKWKGESRKMKQNWTARINFRIEKEERNWDCNEKEIIDWERSSYENWESRLKRSKKSRASWEREKRGPMRFYQTLKEEGVKCEYGKCGCRVMWALRSKTSVSRGNFYKGLVGPTPSCVGKFVSAALRCIADFI